jgi:DNA-binding CsgD family transcriptional regulator
MGVQGTRDLDSKRRHPRHLTDTEREEIVRKVLTQDEQQVFRLLGGGHPWKEIAAELNRSDDAVWQHVQIILVKLSRATPPNPPPTPLAASAALPVPRQRAEDVPTHVGKPLRRKGVKT